MTGRKNRNIGKLRRPTSVQILGSTFRRHVADISGDVRSGSQESDPTPSTSARSTPLSIPTNAIKQPHQLRQSKAVAGPSKLGGSDSKVGTSKVKGKKAKLLTSQGPIPSEKAPSRLLKRGAKRPVVLKRVVDPLQSDTPLKKTTRVRFPPLGVNDKERRQDTSSEDFDYDQLGVKESLEICQGFSKIKIEDWYPFYDFQHHKRKAAETVTAESSSSTEKKNVEESDGEWDETLVYVDLEDIPDVDGLFASLGPNKPTPEDSPSGSLSHLEMKIYDMESKLPVLQLGGKFLAGNWEDTVGTSLFFKKTEAEPGDSPSPHSSSNPPPPPKEPTTLKNIVPEQDIPYDPLFGDNQTNGENGYELVAKSFKILKARYFPVVDEVVRQEEVFQDSDEEYNPRDFQIPPRSMVRQHMTKDFDYEKYVEKDLSRRRKIRKKWSKRAKKVDKQPIVKTEPLEIPPHLDSSDGECVLILENMNTINIEPTPSTSQSMNN